MGTRLQWGITILTALAAILTGGAEWADAGYPIKPINVIVAYPAGGATDLTARVLNQVAEKSIGQPMVVINKGGAGGEIGFAEMARSRADGYTIGWINTPNVITIPIQRKAAFALEDFIPICNIVYDPGVLAVRADSPINTIEQFLEEARKKPGAVNYGTSGIGSDDHIAMLTVEREAGVRLSHVPFDGAAPNLTAVLGGHTVATAVNESEILPHVKTGKVKVIGVMHEKRLASLPQVATFKEKKLNVISSSARGIAAPKGTPDAVVKLLGETYAKAMAAPEFLQKAKELDLPLHFLDSKAYMAFLKETDDSMRALWKQYPWTK